MSPWGYIGTGALLAVVSAFAIAIGMDDDAAAVAVLGYLGAGLASVLTAVGVVAQGVRVGMKFHQFDYADAERQVLATEPE